MDARAEQIGRNEALFREVNERIKDLSAHSADADFLCECGDEACTQPITLTLEEYRRVRSDPRHFALAPGHERPEAERVVSENERFAVVEKHEGLPSAIAEALDPRS